MNPTDPKTRLFRSRALGALRGWLAGQGFLEIDTPLLNTHETVEPHLHSYSIRRPPLPTGNESERIKERFLPTSPEIELKKTWSLSGKRPEFSKIYEISHAFRAGEEDSPWHRSEFLMLEFYDLEASLRDTRKQLTGLLRTLAATTGRAMPGREVTPLPPPEDEGEAIYLPDFFATELNLDWEPSAWRDWCRRSDFGAGRDFSDYSGADLFFLIFLERVEPVLKRDFSQPVFVFGYPESTRAQARLLPGPVAAGAFRPKPADTNQSDRGSEIRIAARMELYWRGVELANTYLEEFDPRELARALEADQNRRSRPLEGENPLKSLLPDWQNFWRFSEKWYRQYRGCGTALGVDRLLACVRGGTDLSTGGSPYSLF